MSGRAICIHRPEDVTCSGRWACLQRASNRGIILIRLQRLFWDYKLSEKDLEPHRIWIVERVLDYGQLSDISALQELYGRSRFLETVAEALGETNYSVSQTTEGTGRINAAVDNQNRASADITANVERIAVLSASGDARVGEVVASVQQLEELDARFGDPYPETGAVGF